MIITYMNSQQGPITTGTPRIIHDKAYMNSQQGPITTGTPRIIHDNNIHE